MTMTHQAAAETTPAPHPEGAKVICEIAARFTKIIDYGIGLEDLLSGKAAVPSAGARFDISFEGAARGPAIEGVLAGTDYLTIRADGRSALHLHGSVTTVSGERIAFFNEGTGNRGAPSIEVLERVELYSASPEYTWVNALAAWGRVSINPELGELRATVYSL